MKTNYNSGGKNVYLTAGEEYSIIVDYDHGLCKYSININVPTQTQTIKNNKFSGKITYTGQTNSYKYVAPQTGTYYFYVTIDNAAGNFNFKISNSKKAELISSTYSSASYAKKEPYFRCDLKANETYTIDISYDYQTLGYSFEIKTEENTAQ